MDKTVSHQYLNLNISLDTGNEVHQDLNQQWQAVASILEVFLLNEISLPTKTYHLSIILNDEKNMQTLNREQRGKDKATDVLSFPQQENLRAGEYEFFAPEEELGDIVICHEVCQRQAAEFNITYTEEFLHLLVHGFLHVCGFDHEISFEQEQLMESWEEKLLAALSIERKKA